MTKSAAPAAATLPYWSDSTTFPTFAKLDRDCEVDVVVVGAGVTGLTAAYLLTLAGKSVAVLERGRCAQVDSGHTSAHLTMVTDVRLSKLAADFGETHAQAVWDGGLAAIAQIDGMAREHQVECDFGWVDGYLHLPADERTSGGIDALEREAALATKLGFDADFVPDVPLVGGPGVRFANQARFHPRKYLAGLARVLRDRGVRIFEHSDAREFVADPIGVRTNGRTIRAGDILIATHNPARGLASTSAADLFQTKLALFTSYVVAGRARRGSVPDALFWDTAATYHYLRIEPRRDHDVIVFGGEDHKTGQAPDTEARFDRLERDLSRRVPGIRLTHRWSGQVIETTDGLPYIGQTAEHQYAATGFGGNGLTFGTLGAMILADAIAGRRNPWAELFDPGRTAIRRELWRYIKENVDYPYYRIRDRFAGAEGKSLRAVGRGQGKVIQYKGAKVAASRSSNGALTLLDAECSHRGCIVGWNDAERTWDCPCHGSRFTPAGDVIAGPAASPLPEVK